MRSVVSRSPVGTSIVGLLVFVGSHLAHAIDVWPSPAWTGIRPENVDMVPAQLEEVRDYALTRGGSGYITRHGKLVLGKHTSLECLSRPV